MTAQLKVVNFKTIRGNEGDAFQFDCKQGRTLLGEFNYDGWGGPVQFDFPNEEVKNLLGKLVFCSVKEYMLQESEDTNIPEFEIFKADQKAIIRECHTWKELEASEACKALSFFEWYANMIYEVKANEKELKKLQRNILKKIHVLIAGKPGTYMAFEKFEFNETNYKKVQDYMGRKYDCEFIILEPKHVERYGIGVMEEAHYALANGTASTTFA